MTPRYIDAHCHVQFDDYDQDRDALIGTMRERNVAGVVVGCNLESSRKAVEVAERHEHLYASIGHHPNDLEQTFDISLYRELAKSSKVVAIGECGLDYFRPETVDDDVKARQAALLKQQITLAAELDKPLIIHSRPSKGTQDAYHDLINILKEAKQQYPHLRGDIHFFVGGVDEAHALIKLGFTLSFTAVITFARDYDEVIKCVPLAAILSETDAPYVAPLARRGKRNDPLSVEDVVAKIAEIRGEDPEMVRETLVGNAQRLFSL